MWLQVRPRKELPKISGREKYKTKFSDTWTILKAII